MDIQSTISSGLMDIVTILIGALVAFLVAFVKQHFSARQIATASWIAADSVNFVAGAAKKLGLTQDSAKFEYALAKAKDLASKAGLNLSDSQWETLLESAYKKAKNEAQPLQEIASTTAPYTEDDIANMIKAELFAQKTAQPQKEADEPVVIDSSVVSPESSADTPVIVPQSIVDAPAPVADPVTSHVDIPPKSITEVIQQTIDQAGEQAKAQKIHDLTQQFAEVVQKVVAQAVDPAPVATPDGAADPVAATEPTPVFDPAQPQPQPQPVV